MTARHGLTSALRPVSALKRAPLQSIHTALPANSTSAPDNADLTSSESEKEHGAGAQLSEIVRALMRTQPHALAAVVSPSSFTDKRLRTDYGKQPPPEQAALLVSSFNTVTLHPRPYVSFNIKTPSATYRAIKASGSFTVSGLKDARTAHAFVAKGLAGDGDERWKGLVDARASVKKSKGGTWWLICKHRSGLSMRVEDHMIVVGEVIEAGGAEEGHAEGAEGGGGGRTKGLMYLHGRYRILSP